MINKSDWTEEEFNIFKRYNFKCLHCRTKDAVTLHELIPKSLAPRTWNRPENKVPLDNACHFWAHSVGTSNSRLILETERETFLKLGMLNWMTS